MTFQSRSSSGYRGFVARFRSRVHLSGSRERAQASLQHWLAAEREVGYLFLCKIKRPIQGVLRVYGEVIQTISIFSLQRKGYFLAKYRNENKNAAR